MLRRKGSRVASRSTDPSDFDDLVSRITPVHELPLIVAALFYGKAGTGKTTLAATFPGPILHLDIREKGTDSISDVKGVDTVDILTWPDFEKAYWYLKSGKAKYKTVIVDAVTQLQDLAMSSVVGEAGKKEDDVVSQRMWGMISGRMKTWIVNYRDLVEESVNVVFLAHTRKNEGEETEDNEVAPEIGPRLMPSVASVLTACVKIIGNTFIQESFTKEENRKIRNVKYCMRLGPHGVYETKIRQPKGSFTPDILEDPSYAKLVSIMKGEFNQPVRKLKKRS
jgi:hypothetical protein